MPNIAKSTFIVFTIAFLYTAAAAQSGGAGGLAMPAAGSQEKVLKVEQKLRRIEATEAKAVAKADREAANVSTAKSMRSSGLSGRSAESDSTRKAASAAPANDGVDPCTINKNLPECKY
jgi:hypothetical protein